MEPNTNTQPKRPWYKRWWVIALGVIIAVGIINQIINPTPNEQAEEPAAVETTTMPEENTDEKQAPGPTEEAHTDLAARVTEAVLGGNPSCDGEFPAPSFQSLCSTSPGFWIADITDEHAGAVRVHIQERMQEHEREDVARWVMQHACREVEDLDLVIAVDLDGYELHWMRSNSRSVCS
ncbi:hypothetical protein [Gulosibacter hominis]|uniref:hypothetical protein n=1 Tax=Gulosibacter hominis TaxID=2770504 RepID=UPI00191975BE|nr:hypothetical protein [Gulosibacter hominis]